MIVELLLVETDDEPRELEVEGTVVLLDTPDELREEEFAGDWEEAPVDALTDEAELTAAGLIARNAVATTPATITIAIAVVASREIADRPLDFIPYATSF